MQTKVRKRKLRLGSSKETAGRWKQELIGGCSAPSPSVRVTPPQLKSFWARLNAFSSASACAPGLEGGGGGGEAKCLTGVVVS